jgi:hypothetical protein
MNNETILIQARVKPYQNLTNTLTLLIIIVNSCHKKVPSRYTKTRNSLAISCFENPCWVWV